MIIAHGIYDSHKESASLFPLPPAVFSDKHFLQKKNQSRNRRLNIEEDKATSPAPERSSSHDTSSSSPDTKSSSSDSKWSSSETKSPSSEFPVSELLGPRVREAPATPVGSPDQFNFFLAVPSTNQQAARD